MTSLHLITNGHKSCTVCGEKKPDTIEFFHWRKDSSRFRGECLLCFRSLSKKRRLDNPEAHKAASKKSYKKRAANGKHVNWRLKYKFNIDLEIYNKMYQEQGGRCKICLTHQSQVKRTLAVDHCHKTGKIRGLLCDNCNLGLGNFQDSFDFLIKASEYLKSEGGM